LNDDARNGRISRRDALKKTAAVGGALWIVPAVQTVNMSKAWAAVGSEVPPESDLPPEETGEGGGPGPSGSGIGDRYTVRFNIDRHGASCSPPSANACRCLNSASLAGGCSFARAEKTGSHGAWTVTIAGTDAHVLEGFAVCDIHHHHRCAPGSATATNAMTFRPHRPRDRRRRRHPITHIEVTFVVPRQGR